MTDSGPSWARPVLLAAAAYNALFGAFAVLWPTGWFELGGMPVPEQLYLWQCIGMIVGVYGVGYACAAFRVLRRWRVVVFGLPGKALGAIVLVSAAVRGDVPWRAGWLIVTNDLVWWLPFAAILLAARRHHRADRTATAG